MARLVQADFLFRVLERWPRVSMMSKSGIRAIVAGEMARQRVVACRDVQNIRTGGNEKARAPGAHVVAAP